MPPFVVEVSGPLELKGHFTTAPIVYISACVR